MSEDGTAAPPATTIAPAHTRGRFQPGRSGNPSGGSRRARADAAPATSPIGRRLSRLDADWVNFFTGQGVLGRDKRMGAHFNVTPLSFDQLMHLWLGDDLAARAVEMIPKEALRQGYDLTVSDSQEGTDDDTDGLDPSEAASEVSSELERLGADDAVEIAAAYERGYGGGAVLIGANDGQSDLTQPLNLKAVRSLDFLNPLEARECMPIYAYGDPRAPKYGQPEIYRLMTRSVLPSRTGFAAQTMEVHESRLLIFPGIRVSRFQPITARGGWGEAVLTRIYRVLRDFNAAYANTGVLINDFSQAVVKIAGLWEALAQDDGAFDKRLEAMDKGRSTINAIAIAAEDSFERQQTPVTGLSDLLERFGVRLAAACDMPLTLLFGTSPAGLNATGESDIRSFYDRVAAYQKRKILPKLRRICEILFRTIGSRREPEKWSIKFRPLWQDSEKDAAAAFLARTQADVALVTASIASPEEIAKAHWGKGEYDPNITIDFAAREAQEAAAAAPVSAADIAALQVPPDDYEPPPGAGTARPQPQVAPPGAPAAVDPSTPPVRTIAAEDRADDWDESQHPRAANGEFGEGGGSAHVGVGEFAHVGVGEFARVGVGEFARVGGTPRSARATRPRSSATKSRSSATKSRSSATKTRPGEEIGERDYSGWSRRTASRLTNAQKQAVKTYTANDDYKEINKSLRVGQSLTEQHASTVAALKRAIAASRTDRALVVFRGMDDRSLVDKLKPGDVFRDRAPISTTADKNIAHYTFTKENGVVFNITVPKGSHALPVGKLSQTAESEKEIILMPGSGLRVDRFEPHESGVLIVHATLVKVRGSR